MKRIAIFAALAAFVFAQAGLAHATPPKPQPTPTNQGAQAHSTAVGLGLAMSGSLSGASAEGGDGLGVGTGGNVGDINVGTGNHKGDATYVLPAPITTLVPQAMGDCTKTDSDAVALLWNAVSASSSKQSAELFCAGMRLSAAYESSCQYLSADMVRNRLATNLFPSFGELPAQPGLQNLTTEQCSARRQAR